MPNAAQLRTRYAGRPVLMRPEAAREVALQLLSMDERALERPSRIGALLRSLRIGRGAASAGGLRPLAMEDDDGPPPVPFEERAAYTPLYVGEAEDFGYCWSLKSGVALMQIDTPLLERGEDFCGVTHGYDTVLAGIEDAAADERVRGTFIRMACPGGVVAGGLETLAGRMRELRAAAGGKPIWIYADQACSAAYWIAAQADRIIAPKVGIVGSIGAVLVHEDWSAALEKAGVAVTAIQFGDHKTDGAWWASLSDEARADLQAEIDQCGRNFVADVAAGRASLTPEALLSTQARCFMAAHDEDARSGLALGFVDEISGEADAFAALVEHVSTPGKMISTPTAVGGRAATKPAKDQPMAETAQTHPGRASALARAQALRAEADRLEAEGGADTTTGGAGEDTVDGGAGEDTVAGEAGADTVSGAAGGDELAANEDDEAEAQAIAASAEAKANPALALSAIQTKMSLAQFKAAAAAAPTAGKGQLAVVMAGASRLGPDAKVDTAAAPVNAAAQFARNLEKGLAGRRK